MAVFHHGTSGKIPHSDDKKSENSGTFSLGSPLYQAERLPFELQLLLIISERKAIKKEGYDIVLNMGNQYSGLKGGYNKHSYKLPNFM